MKAIKYAIWFVLLFVGIFYILPVILFQIPCFQKKISSIVSKYLGEQIGTEVNIDRVEFQFFDKLILKDMYLKDESGDTFFTAKKIVSDFDFFPLIFKHQICINSAQICAFTFNLTRESADTPLNIQYIIDVFARKVRNIELSVRNFSLKGGNFSYRIKDKESTPCKFNSNDIRLGSIEASIQLYEFNNMILKVDIERLSFVEKSGFQVKRLAFDLVIDRSNIRINRFDLNLPTSHLFLTKIVTGDNHSKSIFTNKTPFSFRLEPSQINLKDIYPLIPVSSCFRNQLEIVGKFAGNLDHFKLIGLAVKESDNMAVNADVEISHLNDPFQASIYANVKNAYVTPLKIQKIVNYFNLQVVNLPLLVERLGKVFFNGKISGNLNNLNTNVDINSEVGNLQANIQFGKKRTIGFLSGKVSTFGFNIRKLTNNNNFGSAQLTVNLNSTFNNRWKDWKGNIESSIKEFNYKSFCLENVYLSGNFTSNSFKGLLKTDSHDGQIMADGFILLKGKDSKFNFLVNVSNIAFDKLYSNTKYKDPKLSFIVDANLIGDHMDNFTGNIAFRKLKFSTDKCVYSIDSICIDVTALEENKKQLLLHSDIVNGEIKGVYSMDGSSISENKTDVLHVSFAKVDIGHVFKSLFIRAIDLGGIATGYITVKDVFHARRLFANWNINQFVFNDVTMGDLTLYGKWDEKKQGMEMNGKIVNGDNSFIDIGGFVYPMKKGNSILFDVHDTEIAFLNKYLNNVFSDFSGRLTGKLCLFGDLSNLKIEGDVWIDNGIFGIKYLNTYYTFSDWIKCTPNEISVGDAMVYDKYGNKAIVNIAIKHDAFSNFRFASSLSYKNLLILDTTPNINPLFYGKAFVTGTATLNGNENFLSIKASLCNNKNTVLTFDFAKASDITDYDLKNEQDRKIEDGLKENAVSSLKTKMCLDLIAKINSDAILEITSPLLDNKISSIGNGDLQIQYSTKTPLEVFGKYTIERGKFNLDLQPIISGNFEITKGSSVSFGGDPLTANLDIKASYSISDFMRNNIPISCIFLLSGQLKSPNVKWAFEEGVAMASELEKE